MTATPHPRREFDPLEPGDPVALRREADRLDELAAIAEADALRLRRTAGIARDRARFIERFGP